MIDIFKILPNNKYPEGDIISACIPAEVCIPVTGAGKNISAKPVISAGDCVCEGQEIASPWEISEISICSSIPGEVTGMRTKLSSDGIFKLSAEVKLQGSFSFLGKEQAVKNWREFSSGQLCRQLAQSGVVNTFDKPESLSTQIEQVSDSAGKILCVRMFDRDPSVGVDSYLAENYTREILEGAAVICAAAGFSKILLLCKKRKQQSEVISEFQQSYSHIEISTVPVPGNKYPLGWKQEILKFLKKKSVCPDLTPADIYIDSTTAYAAYHAVVLGKPCMDSVVYVTGAALSKSGVFLVKEGTSISSLVEECGGFIKNPVQIIVNGLISGNSVFDLSTPVTRTTKSIHFPIKREKPLQMQECIRCGKCRQICPESLAPDILYEHLCGAVPANPVYLQTAGLCSSCMLCNAVCPARLPLYQTVCCIKEQSRER